MSRSRHARLEARRDEALDDLAALERQENAAEIDADRAALLRARYEVEVADALAALDVVTDDEKRSLGRVWTGIAIVVVAGALAVFGISRAIKPRPEGGFVTGGVSEEVVDGGLADVSNAELEGVVAANPDVLPMRMALARRYFNQVAYSDALRHYLFVLERGPNSEALANVAWMTYRSGEPLTAIELLERSLELEPGYGPALWFLANVHIEGLNDSSSAVPLLEELIGQAGTPPEIVQAAEEMLARAQSLVP